MCHLVVIYLIDVTPTLREHCTWHGYEAVQRSFAHDPHSTAEGHLLIAQSVMRGLTELDAAPSSAAVTDRYV